MTRRASPKLAAYAVLVAAALLAALVARTPLPAVLAAPFALALGAGLARSPQPQLGASFALERERVLEGDEVLARLSVTASRPAAVDVSVAVPDGLEAPEGARRSVALDAADPQELELPLVAARWGGHAVGLLELRCDDELGFFRFERRLDLRVPLRAYPRQEAVRTLVTPLVTQVGAGNQVAREKGEGIEFADLRPFVPGDRVRRVNWRASARRGELWVNERHAERNADVVLFVDTFDDLGPPGEATLDLAVRGAATLAARYLQRKDRVGLIGFGGVLRWLEPSLGARQLYRLVEALIDTQVVVNYAQKGVDVIPPRTLPPQALVIAVTPLLDSRTTAALVDLRARGFDLAVLDVTPEPHLRPSRGQVGELALRLWRLRREAQRAAYQRAGIAVAEWRPGEPLEGPLVAMEEVRRRARRR
jgi:uncharacterized protein (DUF58 family)